MSTTDPTFGGIVSYDEPEKPAPSKPKQRRMHIKHNVIIKSLMDEPPIRKGTNRHRNMQVVMKAHTVGQALTALKSLTVSPGGSTDIKLAVKAGAIELLVPSSENS
jgi:uncharacterized pyridoxal phosphate-containing UPF0001 family protein